MMRTGFPRRRAESNISPRSSGALKVGIVSPTRMAPGGRIYLEQDRAKPAAVLPCGWHVLKDRTAGNVRYLLAEAGA